MFQTDIKAWIVVPYLNRKEIWHFILVFHSWVFQVHRNIHCNNLLTWSHPYTRESKGRSFFFFFNKKCTRFESVLLKIVSNLKVLISLLFFSYSSFCWLSPFIFWKENLSSNPPCVSIYLSSNPIKVIYQTQAWLTPLEPSPFHTWTKCQII